MSARPTLTIGPETVRMLELGHPWIIADRYTRDWPKKGRGNIVDLADGRGKKLATALFDPGERIIARVLGPAGLYLDQKLLQERIGRAVSLRTSHLDLDGTDVYRLVNGEGDDLPGLVIDRYGDYLMLQLYSNAWEPHLEPVANVLEQIFSPQGIYVKRRPQKTREAGRDATSKLLRGTAVSGKLAVQENGLNFLVDLKSGLNTGLFFDQRRNRRELMARAQGKRVLNLFAYTGAFSVAAAAVGATEVVTVDVSAPYLDWAKENFAANRLNPKRFPMLQGDCLKILEELQKQKKRFDIILMDPPSFSTTRKSRFTTRQGTAELIGAALPLLEEGGLLMTASNHQKIDLADYLKELRRAALQAKERLQVIHLGTQPEDFPYPVTFPEGRYLKFVMAVKG
ncbi:MAG: class I SAM-dependent rRNA methyltransferase [Desulfuromonas sp.]|nr:MAG: class I SAM-dependent rRNA methyltransferase [Desulfuromonas sp.]